MLLAIGDELVLQSPGELSAKIIPVGNEGRIPA
jgi:hypothetical protein